MPNLQTYIVGRGETVDIDFTFKVIGSNRVNTDEIYTPMFHKPLSLFGQIPGFIGYPTVVMSSLRKDDIWLENLTIKLKCI